MQHIQGISRHQLQMISLEDKITADNPVRFIDAFVNTIDLQKIGFISRVLKKEGRPSFDTKVFETINLFLFAKILAAQGFPAKRHFGIVSLWALYRCFAPLQLSILCQRQSPLRHKSAEKGLKSRASEVNC